MSTKVLNPHNPERVLLSNWNQPEKYLKYIEMIPAIWPLGLSFRECFGTVWWNWPTCLPVQPDKEGKAKQNVLCHFPLFSDQNWASHSPASKTSFAFYFLSCKLWNQHQRNNQKAGHSGNSRYVCCYLFICLLWCWGANPGSFVLSVGEKSSPQAVDYCTPWPKCTCLSYKVCC